MLCREVKMSMSPYLDGQLDSVQTRQLEEHLDGCDECQQKLELLKEIPVALRTDRMLAPQTDFTKLVMQRIIVREQVANRIEREIESVEVVVSRARTGNQVAQPTAKVVSLADYKAKRAKRPYEYILQFSSVAAVLVVMVAAGIVATGSANNSGAAAVYGAITGLGENIRGVFSNPGELALGLAVTGIVLIGLWYIFRLLRLNATANEDGNDNIDMQRGA